MNAANNVYKVEEMKDKLQLEKTNEDNWLVINKVFNITQNHTLLFNIIEESIKAIFKGEKIHKVFKKPEEGKKICLSFYYIVPLYENIDGMLKRDNIKKLEQFRIN